MPLPPISAGSGGRQPGTPIIGTATAGDTTATIPFTAPDYLGKPIGTIYTATSTPSSITATSSSSPIVVTGLSNGTAYTFKVKLGNGVATSLESASSNSVTPTSAPVFSFTPFSPFGFTPFGFAPFGPYYSEYSVARNTGILTPSGRKDVQDLQVGDTLYAMKIQDSDPQNWIEWFANDLKLTEDNLTETTITSISKYQTNKIYAINGDLYSGSHYILSRKNEVSKFIRADAIDTSYEVYSYADFDFINIYSVEEIDYEETVYSIYCEPYDNFFTDNMLVFDSGDEKK